MMLGLSVLLSAPSFVANAGPAKVKVWRGTVIAVTAGHALTIVRTSGRKLHKNYVTSVRLAGVVSPSMQQRFAAFLEEHENSEAAQAIVAAEKVEITLFERYKERFSYGYYIARKAAE